MNRKSSVFAVIGLISLSLFVFSCAPKEEAARESKPAAAEGEQLSYVSDDVSFGLFFDSEGTKRTIELKKDQKEFVGYLYLQFPVGMEIAAVQWKLELPEGVRITNDKYLDSRIMSLGQIPKGLSERFTPCLQGSKVLIHELTFIASSDLKNAAFSILPAEDSGVLGIAECIEGYPIVRASSFKAVVNPEN
ncbi:MAG: hypothetical protein JW746_08150 [Candidatus Krumholzibacteriota bacterium]|nr:hypothetical protein [Candidatus Krumholzibacteriota bacterium]